MDALLEPIVGIALFVVLGLPILFGLSALDRPLQRDDGSYPERVARPLGVRMADAARWVVPGAVVAAVIIANVGPTAGIIVGALAVGNLLGTTHVLRQAFPGARSSLALKLTFVLQIPIGTILLMLEGL